MIDDFLTCCERVTLETEVCIAGAGAAGITLARALMAAGIDVCVLESGGLDYEEPVQDLARGASVGFPYYPLADARLRFFGGTTAIWGGRSAELNAIDFEHRPWVEHSGWPFGKDALRPYYERALRLLDLEAPGEGDELWERVGLAPPPFDPALLRGDLWQFDEQFERFTIGRCPDLRASSRVRVLLHATVVDIRTNPVGTAIERVEIANLEGGRGAVRAKIYVLAVGGLEAPRLLLAARNDQPAGLGNQHDLVGRFFMEHPHARGARIAPGDPWRLLTLLPRSHRRNGRRYAAIARPAEALQKRAAILNPSFTLSVRRGARDRMAASRRLHVWLKQELRGERSARLLWRLVRPTLVRTREHVGLLSRWLRMKRGRSGLYVVVRAEQAPNPDSRVTLTSDLDPLGVPRMALDWRFSEIDKRTVRVLMSTLDRELRRLRLGHLEQSAWLAEDGPLWEVDPLIGYHPIGGYHHMGTTRMAISPRRGVVDADCRVHGSDNLYVTGSSVFPTGGWANPTLTILALALRLAGHLEVRLGHR